MGREVRRVPADWVHPVNEKGHHIPLLQGYSKDLRSYQEDKDNWENGIFPSYTTEGCKSWSYEKYAGTCPQKQDYMPEWEPEICTHYQMYETCSEGTPISPVFADPYKLAKWLFTNNASFFGSYTISKNEWLEIILGEAPGIPAFSWKE